MEPNIMTVINSFKAKHVAFKDVEAEAEKYVTISEEEVRDVVAKEKRNKTL